jgi:hypothetical protein
MIRQLRPFCCTQRNDLSPPLTRSAHHKSLQALRIAGVVSCAVARFQFSGAVAATLVVAARSELDDPQLACGPLRWP